MSGTGSLHRERPLLHRWAPLVAEALGRRASLARVLDRWCAARVRLGLGPSAQQAGALLLAVQVDEPACRALVRPPRRNPTRGDLLTALAGVLDEEEAAQALLQLEERGVARPHDDGGGPWFDAELALEPRVRSYCLALGQPAFDPLPTAALAPQQQELAAQVRELLGRGAGSALLVAVRGAAGTGRDTLVRALLAMAGAPALRKTCYELRGGADRLEPELGGFAAVWDARQGDPSPDDMHLASTWLERSPTLAVAVLDRHQDAPEIPGRQLVLLETDAGALPARTHAWSQVLHERGAAPGVAGAAAELLARRSRAGIGLATRAAQMQRPPLPDQAGELVLAIEESLGALARPSSTRGIVVERPEVPFARLVVSDTVGAALEQLMALARLHPELDATSGRRGVKALFAGPSGTGKTMAARAMASELCLPLYRVDLSAVVSKWVGETEKNLRHALEAAEAAGAVLLFDEGDALMSKRGEVTRGTDRYANLEVSYLLQAIETHDGIVVVTTNLRANLDNAFLRRFDVNVDFAPPTRQGRAVLWRQELGVAAGAGLSDRFVQELAGPELTGGNIASAARLALALARQGGGERVSEFNACTAVAAELVKLSAMVQAAQWLALAKAHAR